MLDKLNSAEGILNALKSQHAQAVLDAVLSKSDSNFASLETEIAIARKNVEKLKAAYSAAHKADEETKQAIVEEQKCAKIKSVKASLAIAEKATMALAQKQYYPFPGERTDERHKYTPETIIPMIDFLRQSDLGMIDLVTGRNAAKAENVL